MIVPEWFVSAWFWVGAAGGFFLSLILLFWLAILAVDVLGRTLLRKLRSLYNLGEISYWLDQHRKWGKVMMSDEKGHYVWVGTKKDHVYGVDEE